MQRRKAEREFNRVALKEAVRRMRPELTIARDASHKYLENETDEDLAFDRTVALGWLIEGTEGLCGADLWVLIEIADTLSGDHEEGAQEESRSHQH